MHYAKSILIFQKEGITHINASETIFLEQIIGLLHSPHFNGISIYLLHSSLSTVWISHIVDGQLILWDQANWTWAVGTSPPGQCHITQLNNELARLNRRHNKNLYSSS